MDIKEKIKEESSFRDLSSQKEGEFFMEDPMKKVKIETVTSSSHIKSELVDSRCLQNEEHSLLRFNEVINESEIETKIDIEENDWWLERVDSCINDDIKDETHEDIYSTKPLSLCNEDVSSYTSHLSSAEDLEHYIRFNINMKSAVYETDRKCEGQESDISSIETMVCSEISDDGKILSMASSSKQTKLLLQSNANKLDIDNKNYKSILGDKYRRSYKYDISKKCLKYSSHLEKRRLLLDSKEANKHGLYYKDLNPLSMKSDKQTDEQKGTLRCNICGDAFTVLSDLKKHKMIHKGIKPHKCNICNKAFRKLSNLKIHQLIHEGTKPHKCNICNKAFTQLSNLNKHKFIHERTKSHKCNLCNKAFIQLSNLKRHKLIHGDIKLHKCNICNKAFTHLAHLKIHKLIHEGIKPYKCDICKKAFTQLIDLKRHKLIHDGIKTHKCNICNKAFSHASYLKKHKLIHEDTKPHKCNICHKAFTLLSNLKNHKLIHEDIKPYNCNICIRTFTHLSHLKTHKLIHEGIKPHQCNICKKSFTRLSDLKRHKLIHAGIRPHKCNICNRAFTQLSDLKRHLLTHQNK